MQSYSVFSQYNFNNYWKSLHCNIRPINDFQTQNIQIQNYRKSYKRMFPSQTILFSHVHIHLKLQDT